MHSVQTEVAEYLSELRKRRGDLGFAIASEKDHELVETIQGHGEGDVPIPCEIIDESEKAVR